MNTSFTVFKVSKFSTQAIKHSLEVLKSSNSFSKSLPMEQIHHRGREQWQSECEPAAFPSSTEGDIVILGHFCQREDIPLC